MKGTTTKPEYSDINVHGVPFYRLPHIYPWTEKHLPVSNCYCFLKINLLLTYNAREEARIPINPSRSDITLPSTVMVTAS
jgi:hypothetical protein